MKTKIFSLILTIVLSASVSIAQSQENSKTSFAILGGVNLQNLNGKDYSGDKLKNEMLIGYHAGINIQIPIVPEFYFQPGLLFTTKGSKNTDGLITNQYNLSYVELPLNFVYKGALGNGYIFIGFGPYVAYGIMGKAKYESGSLSYNSDIEFQNVVELGDPITVAYFKAFDAGGNVFAGYEMTSGIFLQLNTQFGMLNINPEDKRMIDDKTVLRNTGFGLSLGYRF